MSSLRLATGQVVDILHMKPKDVRLWDIAWSLDRINRYLGHTPVSWSVLSHTGLCYMLAMVETKNQLNRIDQLAILLHDAAEAYIGDMPSPLKSLDGFQFFKDLDQRTTATILARCGVKMDQVNWNVVERYDKQALHIEMDTFYPDLPKTFAPPAIYPLSVYPKLILGKPQDFVGLVREIAINLHVEDVNDLCYLPDSLKVYADTPAPVVENQEKGPNTNITSDVLNLRLD